MNIVNKPGFRSSIDVNDLTQVVTRQLNTFIPDLTTVNADDLAPFVQTALERIQRCFQGINNKYYNDSGDVYFNHLHSDHYCSFVYLLSNECYKSANTSVATKLFLLNKYLHGLDLYFSVNLPEIFMLVHPVGTVVGNASYGNKIVIYQNCTIGSVFKDGKYIYPTFGENMVLYSRVSVLGECSIGNNVIFGANTFVIKTGICSDDTMFIPVTIVFRKKAGIFLNLLP
jgi:serine O-acetyltransferase